MDLIQSTAFNRLIFMVAASDHITGLAGLTLTITASKDGAAFASISPTVTDLGDGWYSLALTTTHTNTLGCLAFHITGTAADPTDFTDLVVAAAGSAPTAAQVATAVWTDLLAGSDFSTAASIGKLLKDDIDAAISSRLAAASYTAPPSAAAVTTAIWTALLAGSDFSTVASIGKLLKDNVITPPTNWSSLSIDADGRVKALVGLTENAAFADFQFKMMDATGAGVTGLVDADFSVKDYSIGGGAQGTLAGTITEDPGGGGFYLISLLAAELNGRSVALSFEATGTIATQLTIITSQ